MKDPLLCRLGLHRWSEWREVRRAGPPVNLGGHRIPGPPSPAGRWRNCLRCEREQRRAK